MSTLINNIIDNAGKGTPEGVPINPPIDDNGNVIMASRFNDGIGEIKSSPLSPTIDSPEAINLEKSTLPQRPPANEIVKEMMDKTDPDDDTKYLYARYFAQTGNRAGFQYGYTDANGRNTVVVFERGLLMTTDKALVNALMTDITRVGGIGAWVESVSEQHYTELVNKAEEFKTLTQGMAGSELMNPHKLQRDQHLAKLQATIEAQQATINKLMETAKKETMPEATPPVSESDKKSFLPDNKSATPQGAFQSIMANNS